MGLIYAEVELINSEDILLAKRHIIGEEEIKHIHVNMLVDSGANYMCINESIQELLNLPFIEKRKFRLANGHVEEYDIVGPMVLKFKNRQTSCDALVLSGDNEPLLGAIPLEALDVIIHPQRQEMIVNPDHPDYALLRL